MSDIVHARGLGLQAWPAAAVRALVGAMADGVVVLGEHGAVTMHNAAAATLLGEPAGGLVGERPLDGAWRLLSPDGHELAPGANPLLRSAELGAATPPVVLGLARGGGRPRWLRLSARPLPLGGGASATAIVLQRASRPVGTASTLAALGAEPAGTTTSAAGLLDLLFGQEHVGLALLDPSGRLSRVNDALAKILAAPATTLTGAQLADLAHPDDREAEAAARSRLLSGSVQSHTGEYRFVRPDETVVFTRTGLSALRDERGDVLGLLAQVVDVSRQRRAEEFMYRRTLHDPLTGLVNRVLLLDLLGDALHARSQPLALIALNLDRFKAVNDSLGQATGDHVLTEVADRIRTQLRPGDAAARLGGDDFVVIAHDVGRVVEAEAFCTRLLDAIGEPFDIGGLRVQITASAGVAMTAPRSGKGADAVLTQATGALKRAKQRGRARVEIYDEASHADEVDRLYIETALRSALASGEISVSFQPVVRLADYRPMGAEALMRWSTERLGLVPPATFLPVAEDNGLIVPLGEYVIDAALREVARWRTRDPEVHVAVNLSPHQLNRGGAARSVEQALASADLDPSALRLEITESVVIEAGETTRANLADLRSLGVQLGIDDFGTGYASMAYLKNLPIDFVKIDRSFVDGLGTNREDTAIVRAVLALAESLGLSTVAEGVETTGQVQLLREMGCELGQGFLFGRPGPGLAVHNRL